MSIIKEDNYLNSSINYCFYSKLTAEIPKDLITVLNIFKKNIRTIESINNKNYGKRSDSILEVLNQDLINEHFQVEFDKKHQIRIKLNNDELETKEFRVDAINVEKGIIIEIEAGRAVANYQFLKDIMEASMISNKKRIFINNKIEKIDKKVFLVVAVRNVYTINKSNHYDYKTVVRWLNTIDISNLNLELNGILLIGY